MLFGLLLALPILLGLSQSQSSTLWLVGTSLTSPVYGILLWRFTTWFASRKADAKTPELIQVFATAP